MSVDQTIEIPIGLYEFLEIGAKKRNLTVQEFVKYIVNKHMDQLLATVTELSKES